MPSKNPSTYFPLGLMSWRRCVFCKCQWTFMATFFKRITFVVNGKKAWGVRGNESKATHFRSRLFLKWMWMPDREDVPFFNAEDDEMKIAWIGGREACVGFKVSLFRSVVGWRVTSWVRRSLLNREGASGRYYWLWRRWWYTGKRNWLKPSQLNLLIANFSATEKERN